ncbi:serine/threonine protein phosphatase PrpC [Microbacteriaceae bacterium SG_E_30_P1]|uniref:Serine/threonine protein phosphatase PrpC n=1 Tax=Antiquaquibacter oligotrophicus TaxID=2880260 RepID=A0ABT6KTC4_9MICO|nr:PP2C family serine/threonine-protein phosphatase [Antiquaquibacter oligotrophicus]MDH6182322.1 serine/threonine protein phosphatase PrpC [Antiquaquibacter oligotrophicus]UDF12025.1 protein phosphatase 2C domain-containing protein [Antiquaquibacter oligotrophicus]
MSRTAAVSHVGKVRSNNQDSAYAGRYLFVVADGMGGHAGGDVASAIAVKRIAETDQAYTSPHDAEYALKSALLSANSLLAETVFEHSELTGMGTTVSGMLRVGDKVAIAHIGDSRVYRFRDGDLEQVTTDHTFVQRLVDSGRITPDEAAVHPRRSVLMRVLGDVDASPEIDTSVLDTRPGDRWLLCSDGLSSFVGEEKIAAILRTVPSAREAADRLVKESLDQGAPDNVTIVVVDVDDSGDDSFEPPTTVGSAALPLSFGGEIERRAMRLPSLLLHPLKATPPDDSHFEPESDDYLQALIQEDRKRARRRRVTWLVFLVVAIAAIVFSALAGYQFTQRHFFVGESDGRVAIYQGVQQDIGPIQLSHIYEQTTIELDTLPPYLRSQVESTMNASDLLDAKRIVEELADARTEP